ncbi:MAG: hypothetical protein ABIJ56_04035 [Pseudomonadota bacterium]
MKSFTTLAVLSLLLLGCDSKSSTDDDADADAMEDASDVQDGVEDSQDDPAADTTPDTEPDPAQDPVPDIPDDTADAGEETEPTPCEIACEEIMEADCSEGPDTLDDCITGCEWAAAGACSEFWEAVMACAGDSPSFYCTDEGAARVEGCDDEHDVMDACLYIVFTCEDICEGVMDADCSEGPSTMDDCLTGCAETAWSSCAMPWEYVVECAGDDPTFYCTDEDMPRIEGCDDEHDALDACLTYAPVCEHNCEAIMEADCSSGPETLEGCIEVCESAASGQCAELWGDADYCAGPDPTFTCSDEGMPMVEGCEEDLDALNECVHFSNLCEINCEELIDADCSSGPDTIDECLVGCYGTATGECFEWWWEVVECAGDTPTYYCTEGGMPRVEGCDDEHDALDACLYE